MLSVVLYAIYTPFNNKHGVHISNNKIIRFQSVLSQYNLQDSDLLSIENNYFTTMSGMARTLRENLQCKLMNFRQTRAFRRRASILITLKTYCRHIQLSMLTRRGRHRQLNAT